ncbi:MAG: hypothetical protein A2017_00860 [Lentisphaerae bacterium GWF2_44_16]|nr:MAG: hypothetical protein A2017_00860 [Lentisphaerae bacterium GWF2_44_16]
MIAVYNKFLITTEIIETFNKMGKKVSLFTDENGLLSIKNGNTVDFVMDINFHGNVHDLCIKYDLPYIVWSFDSGVRTVLSGITLRNKDFLFLFNRTDYLECSKKHGNTYFLPFSASDSFIIPGRESNDFDCDILLVMNSYNETVMKSETLFQKTVDASQDEIHQKSYRLIKSLMDLVIEKHKDIFDKNLMLDFLEKSITECGVDPFREGRKETFCEHYGQVLSSIQREICLNEICLSGHKVHVYGDSYWEKILKPFSNASFFSNAGYDKLSSLYNSSKININLTQIQNIDSIPQRIFHVLAAGGFLLSNYSEELVSVFKPLIHLETFRNVQELKEKINYYLNNENMRLKIAGEGHVEFIKFHKMESRLAFICGEFSKKSDFF